MLRITCLFLAVGAAFFHLFSAGVAPFTALVQRPIHLAFMATLGFLGVGARVVVEGSKKEEATEEGQRSVWWIVVDGLLIAAVLVSSLYLVSQHEALVRRAGSPTAMDLVGGLMALVVVLELARRTTGWGLVVVAVLAILYAVTGPFLPGFLAHRGYGFTRLMEHLYLSTEGIWGVPLGVSADFVYLFVLFGALLDMAGGGALLIGLADRATGRTRGGPAKTAALASALMGSLSGSAVANVVTTGTFTIPLMRRSGFKPFFAGAIEAAASTGGQLMPPVMGAGAFILATWTNIPYPRVAVAAIVPAVLYYVALLMAIHFRAGRMGLEGSRLQAREAVLPRLHLLLPLGFIVLLLAMGRSPMRAAFWGVVTALGVSLFTRQTRPNPRKLEKALVAAGGGAVQVAAACAAAGVVVGVASLTGIGLRMSELIITLSQGNLFLALLLTAMGSIVLGMGLPTTAAYVVLAALGAPALIQLDVPVLAAHLFIFYFGCISNVTPPVSLAAYAASGIAGSPPLRTAWTAMVLAFAGFLVPFMFVYGPPLLLVGSAVEIGLVVATGLAGVTALAASTMGYLRGVLAAWERVLLGFGAVALIFPDLVSDGAGLLILLVVFLRSGEKASNPSA
ncbi:MAG: TRAP transporter fused permease subunit [Gemmatimonadota bacterium]|jgi:TRAP transporter 4TM/12TM fusion protein